MSSWPRGIPDRNYYEYDKCLVCIREEYYNYLSLLASLSDSIRAMTSPFLTGPLMFLTRDLLESLMKTTLTWVIPPLDPITYYE